MDNFSALHHLTCSRCGAEGAIDELLGLCSCGSPYLAVYDLEQVARTVKPSTLADRPPSLWRYHELLPARDPSAVVSLGEGMTPLIPLPTLGAELGVSKLFMKDESALPTGSFKARGATVGVTRARELGARSLAMPTNGNAGAAWAVYSARAGIPILVAMPTGAPKIHRVECAVAGAELVLVRGHIGDAGRLVAEVVARRGDFDVSTLKEPYRIEGKKTIGYEIVEQLGWKMPDVIVCPTGGGVGVIGIYRALNELRRLGWTQGEMPRLVAVQAAGCSPIVRAFEAGQPTSEPWLDPSTVAFGINVPKATGDFLILEALRSTTGTAVAVEDSDLLDDQRVCAGLEGCFMCPEGAATVSAVRQLRDSGWLGEDDVTVVLNTGVGIKYADPGLLNLPEIEPEGSLEPN